MNVTGTSLNHRFQETRAHPTAFESPLDAMPPPEDIGAQIAIIVMQSARERRQLANQLRNATNALEDSRFASQIEQMRKAANWRLVGGVTEGSLKIASAAAAYASVANAKSAAADASSASVDTAKQRTEDLTLASKCLDAGAITGASAARYMADRAQEGEQSSARQVAAMQRRAEDIKAEAREADEAIAKAISFLREWAEKRHQAQAAALYGR